MMIRSVVKCAHMSVRGATFYGDVVLKNVCK